MKILVVDDSETSRLLHKTVIRRLVPNAIVKDVIDGFKGLQELYNARETYDIVITDFDMPRLNGYEMVKQAKEMNLDFISICITGDDISKHIEEFDLVLQKPVNKEDLRKGIVNLFLKTRK